MPAAERPPRPGLVARIKRAAALLARQEAHVDLGKAPTRVQVQPSERLLDGFFRVDRYRLRHERYDGSMSDEIERLVFERGDGVTVLPYDPARRLVFLVQQFRFPAYLRDVDRGWLWECIAGAQDRGRTPEQVARAEAMEEAGLELGEIEFVTTIYVSPGGSTERLHLYLAPVALAPGANTSGGESGSDEDIRGVVLPIGQALEMIRQGDIADAKTIILLRELVARSV